MYGEELYFGPRPEERVRCMEHANKIIALGWGDYNNLIAIKVDGGNWIVAGCKEIWHHAHLMGFCSLTNSNNPASVSDADFAVLRRTATREESVCKDYLFNQSTCVMYFRAVNITDADFESFCNTHDEYKWWNK